jgi:hypothetical protein
MTATKSDDQEVVNTAVKGGDHDRVAMLSLNVDGSPDQHDPEIIGDKDWAEKATAEQFRQQAVSAADVRERAELAKEGKLGGAETSTTEDPSVEQLKKAHDNAAKGAESSAKKVVNALHKGNGDS